MLDGLLKVSAFLAYCSLGNYLGDVPQSLCT